MEQQKTVLTWKVELNLPEQDYLMVHVFENDTFQYPLQVLKNDKIKNAQTGFIIQSSIVEFNYLSPDGFTISMDNFPTIEKAESFLNEWIKRYEAQCYYSSSHFGRIPLNVLSTYCMICRYIEE